MADLIKGITLKINGDTTELSQSLRYAQKEISDCSSALRSVEKALKLDPSNIELVGEKQKLLATIIKDTEDKLNAMKEAASRAMETLGEEGGTTEHDMAKLKAQIVETEAKLNNYKSQAEDAAKSTEDLADSAEDAGDAADDAGDEMDDLGKKTKDSGDKASDASGKWEAFGEVMKRVGEVAAAAVSAAAVATGKLIASAVEGYANIEQLEGGMQKLFGDEDAKTVIANANDAFKTAGMSAEEYMSTATSISASLINSLGGDTEAAADMVDVAIRAMSDNASVFGTDLGTIQSAFVGFSRGQFQMLDSLSLGYAGTQEGMINLINDSGIFQEKIESLENVDFADMVTAIQTVQENMGIAGNTMAEADKTISGSVDSMKSAWQNWVTGLADSNADVEQLTTNLVDSALTALDNISPAIKQAVEGLKVAIPMLATAISDNLPSIISDLLPPLLLALTELLSILGQSIPTILDTVISALPDLLSAASMVIEKLAMGLLQALPNIIPTVIDVLMGIVDFAVDNIDLILEISFQIFEALISGITKNLPILIPAVISIINSITEFALSHIDEIITMAIQLILGLATGFVAAIPDILASIPQIISAIVGALGDLGGEIVDMAWTWGSDLIDNLVTGISGGIQRVKDAVSGVAQAIRDFIGFSEPKKGPLSNFHTFAPDMIDLWNEGVEENLGDVSATMKVFGNTVADGTQINYSGQLSAINSSIGALGGGKTVIPVYIGNRLLDTVVAEAQANNNMRGGGR